MTKIILIVWLSTFAPPPSYMRDSVTFETHRQVYASDSIGHQNTNGSMESQPPCRWLAQALYESVVMGQFDPPDSDPSMGAIGYDFTCIDETET